MSVIGNTTATMIASIAEQQRQFDRARKRKITLTERTFVNGTLYEPGDIIDEWMLPKREEETLRPLEQPTKMKVEMGLSVLSPKSIARVTSNLTRDVLQSVKRKLLAGDPDWQEFKRRWADEFGPIGDEQDYAPAI